MPEMKELEILGGSHTYFCERSQRIVDGVLPIEPDVQYYTVKMRSTKTKESFRIDSLLQKSDFGE